tara:strand:+ start:3688 stop:4461 length:774 start_codon:yes stop_codon:yes gene_type:complete
MNHSEITKHITDWLINYANKSGSKGFVVGVSGGVDSALTSTLGALTNLPVIPLSLPINQEASQHSRSLDHIDWLEEKFNNIKPYTIDLTDSFNSLVEAFPSCVNKLALANTASRLRMTAIYSIANTHNYLVLGTGNKVEDYGIGFFTKYGDGGVDLSPIADLTKNQVYSLAKELDILEDILAAPPTDGLWDDNRTDEDQIGASYDELEWALNYYDIHKGDYSNLSLRQKEVLDLYTARHLNTKHKLLPPPTCLIPNS